MKPNIRYFLPYFLALSFWHQSVVSAAPCPNGCFCQSDNLMNCTNPTFPMLLPSRAIDNIIIRGKILSIPANAYVQPEGNTLKSLTIYPNEISNIKSHAFNNLVLDMLSIYSARIKHLEARVFSNMTAGILTLVNCEFDTIPAFFFGGLTSALLSVYNNNITTLETNVFKSANASKGVAFYNNKIDIVQKNALNAGNLKLDVYSNKIKKFYIQDLVAPRSFYSNKIMCICSLAWMWQAGSIFGKFLASNGCLKTNQYGGICLKDVNQTLLCTSDNSSQTTEWETRTTKINTEHFESSSRTSSKETHRTEDTTRFKTTQSSDPESSSLKHSVNLALIIIESVIICLFILS